jgi:two-component system NtrC family sensor kinase
MTAPPARPTRHALIVDDEEVIRRAMRRSFQRDGWAVDEADDGASGLALLLGEGAPAYAVILSDLRMPGMSGEEFFDAVAAARPALAKRIIVTTGDAFTAEAARFIARSGCAVLNKPFELAELRAVVERVAGQA